MLHLPWMGEPSTALPSHHDGPNALNHEPALAPPSLSCFCQVFAIAMRRITVTVVLILRLFYTKLITSNFGDTFLKFNAQSIRFHYESC